MDEPKKRLSKDEIEAEIHDLARNGDGADKRWALKKLSDEEVSGSTLAEPINDTEVVKRTARIMRAAGYELSRAAFVQAFNNYNANRKFKRDISVKVEAVDLDIDKDNLPKTLKAFYKKYPEKKRHGFPEGFPVGQGPIEKMEWCQNTSLEIERERERAKAANIVQSLSLNTPTDGNDGIEGSPEQEGSGAGEGRPLGQ